MLELNTIPGTRIVASPAALDSMWWPDNAIVIRSAPDEVFVNADISPTTIEDEFAIVVSEFGVAGAWVSAEQAAAIFEQHIEWQLPSARPAFAQGNLAGIAVKLWLEEDRVLILCPLPFSAELQERLA